MSRFSEARDEDHELVELSSTEIPDVKLVRLRKFQDDRGYFFETWSADRFREAGLPFDFVQDNQAGSVSAGTMRGLHYQTAPNAQGKLIGVIRGSIFDVAVDIRHGSPTFGRSIGVTLTAADPARLWVPPGFAHGYVTLEPDTEVVYKVTSGYAPKAEGGIRWDDPALGIDWPIAPGEMVVNDRDRSWPRLADAPVHFRHGAI
ncbi:MULTISPECIES: dTDP-4-dehydrorhamnose 3,5-epimerase [unclassified Inquilinus]|uniref:dTDP-4-dehydrorhamnose 3,5-epimerase n=1 Tax=unclassified Inquilinus TaxID=2645927 RepID=UPI003F930A14